VIMGSLVSLVMTVYNRERYLGTAIESVLKQTYRDFELIVWDDGSTDRSVEIAQEYAAQDGRVQVIAAAHQGRARALKAAHGKASGDYVGWIDSDDALAAKALELTVARLAENPGLGMVYTNSGGAVSDSLLRRSLATGFYDFSLSVDASGGV
jgi:glycosyltransferase involved in cell wall biosynthesis